jgi:uncharacterized protein (TIGR03435 family)
MPITSFKRITVRDTVLALLLAMDLTAHPTPARSQSPPSQPAFEAASIRQVEPHSLEDLMKGVGVTSISPWGTNRFIARNITLSLLVQIAYGTDGKRLFNEPNWFDSELYDVSAKAEGDTKLTKEQMQPLLCNLLEQRFHLVTHMQKKEVQGYALVEAKGGAKLKASSGQGQRYPQIWGEGLMAYGSPVATLARLLEGPAGRPIIDKTGIQGTYDFDLRYSSLADPDSNLSSVFTVLQEQLGLKLESQKVPVELLVIDHVDRVPTEN